MGVDEMIEWIAYDLSNTDEFKEKLKIQEQKEQTAEEEAQKVRNFFMGLQCQ